MTTVKNQKQDEASTQSLDVYLHGERIGIITRGQDPEGPSFQYLESYRTRSGAIALGRQIPLTEEPTRSETILRWIDGLLPEGDRRGDLTRQLGLHRMSTWSLIREIGLDCAGAVQVADPHHRTGRPSYYKASEAEIGLAFDQIAQRPIQTFERGARLSSAGAQEKDCPRQTRRALVGLAAPRRAIDAYPEAANGTFSRTRTERMPVHDRGRAGKTTHSKGPGEALRTTRNPGRRAL